MASGRRMSAGIVVLRETPDGPLLLLLRAYRNWDFPKGLVEAGEEPLDAAVRETREETGIAELAFDWGARFIDTGPYAGNKIARYFIARTRTADVTLHVNPALGRPEHHEYRWVSVETALRLAAPRVRQVVAWAVKQWLAKA
jgi:bis(5'-nucleosidyl)-tetraphosphatase